MTNPAILNKKIIDMIKTHHPQAFAKPKYLRMIGYLLTSNKRDRYTNKILVSHFILADIEKKLKQFYNKNYCGLDFLNELKNQVLPGLTWADHDYLSGKCRQIISSGIDQSIIEEYAKSSINDLDIFMDSGKKITAAAISDARSEIKKNINDLNASLKLNDEQKLISNYLNNLPDKIFTEKYLQNVNNTLTFIDTFDFNKKSEQEINKSRDRQRQILKTIRYFPKPFYSASDEAKSPRIHAQNETFLGLKREVRKVFCDGWHEADLKNSQLCLIACCLKSKTAIEFCRENNVWKELAYAALGRYEFSSIEKNIMKTSIYALCFGKSDEKLFNELKTHGMEKMLKHPAIEDLLKKRRNVYFAINKTGGCNDAFGKFTPKSKDRWHGSLLAQKIQGIELKLISSLFEIAISSKNLFTITTFLHDGVTFSCRERDFNKICDLFKKTIAHKANELDVISFLEITR